MRPQTPMQRLRGHAIARAKLNISDRKVLKSARAPIVKKALDKNITVLKDYKTCSQ